jgi:phosphoglycerol transferase
MISLSTNNLAIAMTNIRSPSFKLFLIILFIALFLLFRSFGLYPSIFGDEYYYSTLSRLSSAPVNNIPNIPDYLYYSLYTHTTLCGHSFLDCVRLLNVIFFVSAAPFIYAISRATLISIPTSIFITTISLIGAINVYTAYFMPEALYFLFFWMCTWLALRYKRLKKPLYWLVPGLCLGLMTLIKPNALFLLPAFGALFFFFFLRDEQNDGPAKYLKSYGIFLAATIVTKLVIGIILAGKNGLTLFGGYSNMIPSSTIGLNGYKRIIELAYNNLMGHLVGLSLLFSVPAAEILLSPRFLFRQLRDRPAVINIVVYAALVFACLLIVTTLFTASAAVTSPYENTRLHMRYYNFAFPLFIIIGAVSGILQTSTKWRLIAGAPICLCILYGVCTHLSGYTLNIVDSPELRGLSLNQPIFWVLSGMSLLSLMCWVYAGRLGAKVFTFLFLPFSVAFSGFYANQELRQHLSPDVYDRAGLFAKTYLPGEELSKLSIAGQELGGLFKSAFHVDTPEASIDLIPMETEFDLAQVPSGKDWVLLIGDYHLPENTFLIQMNGFALVRAASSQAIDFRRPLWPGVIGKSRGLALAEAWGRWSLGDVVTLEFSDPLPPRFTIHLLAQAYGPNAGKLFVAHVGDSTIEFTLSASPETKVLEILNPRRSRVIKIDVPFAISPKELGASADERKLGLGFIELRIVPL